MPHKRTFLDEVEAIERGEILSEVEDKNMAAQRAVEVWEARKARSRPVKKLRLHHPLGR